MNTKKIAACAVMVALLIVVQFALSFVPGIELVTVLLLCFCYVFGILCGVITATAFSLLRCMLFGFMPNVLILYLVYYNLLALLFGSLKNRRLPSLLCPILLCALAVGSAYFAAVGIPISILYQTRIRIMLWIFFGIVIALLFLYVVLIVAKKDNELAGITALAAFCTILFTLLDDIISPLILGYGTEAAVAYFYTSFLAMLPQTICTAVSVFLLFSPIKKLLTKVKQSSLKEPLK